MSQLRLLDCFAILGLSTRDPLAQKPVRNSMYPSSLRVTTGSSARGERRAWYTVLARAPGFFEVYFL